MAIGGRVRRNYTGNGARTPADLKKSRARPASHGWLAAGALWIGNVKPPAGTRKPPIRQHFSPRLVRQPFERGGQGGRAPAAPPPPAPPAVETTASQPAKTPALPVVLPPAPAPASAAQPEHNANLIVAVILIIVGVGLAVLLFRASD